ncbi:invasion associated locus B family protein [Rhodoplanes sp. TEM]|uniref:Invasion associated locus B family protein n=2 Tax=Rhodoplanes TaxID=29407 RepID=A0ABT5JBB9_RHOTP|nr:invasion associated locus B family protein [Rhodoplanes tepidamans]MDC7786897.1 invasion associated locus B family protein [Rhodoplanes tepidamans]MDC7987201.1 invasion associated locus B family protein [Rhodoplanes sp. TEM]
MPPAMSLALPALSRLAAVLLAAAAVPALAQTPSRTTATYEDWTVRCETPAGSQQKTCEVFQAQQPQGQPGPVSQVAIGRAAKTAPLKLVVQLPVNVWLAAAPRLVLDDKQPPVTLGFRRCLPGGCFADADLPDDVLRRLRARAEPIRLEYKDAIQRDVGIAISLKGFSQALEALAKQ